jgi:hypothetical protein
LEYIATIESLNCEVIPEIVQPNKSNLKSRLKRIKKNTIEHYKFLEN